MNDRWKVPLAVLSVVGLAAAVVVVLLVHTLPAAAQDSCSGVQVTPGDDLDAIVNGDPRDRATTFCVNAHSDGTTATYNISATLLLRDGDRLLGQTGETVTIDAKEHWYAGITASASLHTWIDKTAV
jgi:hypothetical protein